MKKENVFFSRKEFLNLPGQHSTGNIVAHIVKYDMNEEGDSQRVDLELYVSDCSRSISLDLGVGDEYERENTIHKLDTMIDVLTEMRDATKKVCKHQHRLEKKYKRRRIAELEEKKGDGVIDRLNDYEKRELNRLRAEMKND